jgi:hypothetical protein
MSNHDPDPKRDPNRASSPANDNGGANDSAGKTIAPAPKASALASTSLTNLAAMLGNVVRSAPRGRPSMPIISFRSREGGIWTLGQQRIIIAAGTRAAVNLASVEHGYICFGNDNSVVDEELVPGSEPKPNLLKLLDRGFPWVEQLAVNMKLIDGPDAGAEGVYKPTTVGGRDAVLALCETARNRIRGPEFDGKDVPVVRLERDSYLHPSHGRIWIPILTLVDWMSDDGPAPAPEPAPPPPEQPRRRRVA